MTSPQLSFVLNSLFGYKVQSLTDVSQPEAITCWGLVLYQRSLLSFEIKEVGLALESIFLFKIF